MILIIGGFPRAGTRQFTDILNFHPNVDIRGEMHRAHFTHLAKWLTYNDKSHGALGLKERYLQYRILTGLNSLVGMGRGENAPFTLEQFKNGFCGFKCPMVEVEWKRIKRILPRDVGNQELPNWEPIRFLFCTRTISQAFLSKKRPQRNFEDSSVSVEVV